MSRARRAFRDPELEVRVLNGDGSHEVIDLPADYHEACLVADCAREAGLVVIVWSRPLARAVYDSRIIALKCPPR